jgi:hypothetical protein
MMAVFFVTICFIQIPQSADAQQEPVYQLVDSTGALIGVVWSDLNGPIVEDDSVRVFVGMNAFKYPLSEPVNWFENHVFKGNSCEIPWFTSYRYESSYIARLNHGRWFVAGKEISTPKDEMTSNGWSAWRYTGENQPQTCFSSSSSYFAEGYEGYVVSRVKSLVEVTAKPNPSSIVWPLKVVRDSEINGPLFFNLNTFSCINNLASIHFSSSEPFQKVDVLAKSLNGKTIRKWKNQPTGARGAGAVNFGKCGKSMSNHKFSLIYKGKVVATLP